MRAADLIVTAKSLATKNQKRPRQPDLRRALSTAYYALFHFLARSCADYMIGGTKKTHSKPAWRQVYRALEHGSAKNACTDGQIKKFPREIQDFANVFKDKQEKRHEADYDPFCALKRSEVLNHIETVEEAISLFDKAMTKDKIAFCALVLFKKRQ